MRLPGDRPPPAPMLPALPAGGDGGGGRLAANSFSTLPHSRTRSKGVSTCRNLTSWCRAASSPASVSLTACKQAADMPHQLCMLRSHLE